MQFDENKLIAVAKPYLERARSGDWEHALRAVKWVKELGASRKDLYLLITAAYIHDIGWSGVAPLGKISLEEVIKLEPKANQNSNPLIEEALTKLNFSKSEIDIVKRLVVAADKHQSEQDDEAVVVDADNLCKLSIDHLQAKFKPESFISLVNLFEKEFVGSFRTPRAKEIFPELLEELKKQILLQK